MSSWLAYAAMAAVLVPLVLMGIGYLLLPRRQNQNKPRD
jgi:ABC-type Fe3+ transport system permease subunit